MSGLDSRSFASACFILFSQADQATDMLLLELELDGESVNFWTAGPQTQTRNGEPISGVFAIDARSGVVANKLTLKYHDPQLQEAKRLGVCRFEVYVREGMNMLMTAVIPARFIQARNRA